MFWSFRTLLLVGGMTACLTVPVALGDQQMTEQQGGEKWANLPLPKVGVRVVENSPLYETRTYSWIRMPQIPLDWGTTHNVFDIQFEEPHGLQLLEFRVLEGGVLEVRHRLGSQPHLIFVSELTPEPGKVQLVVRPELDTAMGAVHTQLSGVGTEGRTARQAPLAHECLHHAQ